MNSAALLKRSYCFELTGTTSNSTVRNDKCIGIDLRSRGISASVRRRIHLGRRRFGRSGFRGNIRGRSHVAATTARITAVRSPASANSVQQSRAASAGVAARIATSAATTQSAAATAAGKQSAQQSAATEVIARGFAGALAIYRCARVASAKQSAAATTSQAATTAQATAIAATVTVTAAESAATA